MSLSERVTKDTKTEIAYRRIMKTTGGRVFGRNTLSKRVAIAEGLAEHHGTTSQPTPDCESVTFEAHKEATMHNQSLTAYSTDTRTERSVSRLARNDVERIGGIGAVLNADVTARNIRRPQVAKRPFSRTAAQAAREDGVDLSVTVRQA